MAALSLLANASPNALMSLRQVFNVFSCPPWVLSELLASESELWLESSWCLRSSRWAVVACRSRVTASSFALAAALAALAR